MEATDLMKWDWVKITDDDSGEWFFGIVCGIDRDNVLIVKPGKSIGYPYAEECIEPVPITPEILEKNGFLKTDDWFCLANDYYDIDIIEISDSIWRVRYDDLECSAITNTFHICYVHELQRALKLCQIDKTIEL